MCVWGGGGGGGGGGGEKWFASNILSVMHAFKGSFVKT